MTAVERIAERARRRRIAQMLTAELPDGVTSDAVADGVVLSGRGLRRRMLSDVRLRALGWWESRR